MFPVLWPFATFMGSYTRTGTATQVEITSSWFKNDGVVNSISQDGPSIGCSIRSYATAKSIGVGIFNDMGVKQGWDHLDINGLSTDPLKYLGNDFTKFYIALAKTLAALPVVNSQRLDSNPIEVNVTSSVPLENEIQLNVTALTCDEAETVYESMCVNSTLGSGLTFSAGDCASIQSNVKDCQTILAGASAIRSPLSWIVVMASFALSFFALST